jgi:hypothetical protein
MSAPTYKPSIDSTADEELHRYVTEDQPRAQKMTATRGAADNTQLIVSGQASKQLAPTLGEKGHSGLALMFVFICLFVQTVQPLRKNEWVAVSFADTESTPNVGVRCPCACMSLTRSRMQPSYAQDLGVGSIQVSRDHPRVTLALATMRSTTVTLTTVSAVQHDARRLPPP